MLLSGSCRSVLPAALEALGVLVEDHARPVFKHTQYNAATVMTRGARWPIANDPIIRNDGISRRRGSHMRHRSKAGVIIAAGLFGLWLAASAQGQGGAGTPPPPVQGQGGAAPGGARQGGRGGRGGTPAVTGPWSDKSLSPDQRADLLIEKMTLDEKIQLLHGSGGGRGAAPAAPTGALSNGGAGWVPGIERLGIPDINMADSAVGVTHGAAESRYSPL